MYLPILTVVGLATHAGHGLTEARHDRLGMARGHGPLGTCHACARMCRPVEFNVFLKNLFLNIITYKL